MMDQEKIKSEDFMDAYYKALVDSSPTGVMIINNDVIYYHNTKAKHLLSQNKNDDFTKKNISELIYPGYQDAFKRWMNKISEKNVLSEIEIMLVQDKNPLYVMMIGQNIKLNNSQMLQIHFYDISQKKQAEINSKYAENNIEEINRNDYKIIEQYLKRSIHHAATENKHLAVMYMDINKFHFVSESYGQKISNLLVEAAIHRLKQLTDAKDAIFTLHEDKFCIVLNSIANHNEAEKLVNRFIHSFDEPFVLNNIEVQSKLVAGISLYPEDGNDTTSLIKAAEIAHYRAKNKNGTHYQFFSQLNIQSLPDKVKLLNELKHALTKNQFELYYQPIMDNRTGKIANFEALLRWRKGPAEIILPGEFLSLAEETGLIPEIGNWVIKAASEKNLAWSEKGYPTIPISINLSTKQLYPEAELIENLSKNIQQYNIAASTYQFEIASNATILDISAETLQRLNEMGASLTINNFGCSYFSLCDLTRYHVNTIKIDYSLIKDIPQDTSKTSIVSAIIAMANKLNIKVTAEGVENNEQIMFLKKHGCHYVQGNFICPAISSNEIDQFIQSNMNFACTI